MANKFKLFILMGVFCVSILSAGCSTADKKITVEGSQGSISVEEISGGIQVSGTVNLKDGSRDSEKNSRSNNNQKDNQRVSNPRPTM